MPTATTIKTRFLSLADAGRATQMRKFFKMGEGQYAAEDQFYGVYTADLRKLAKEYSALSFTEIEELLQSSFNEERQLALMILNSQFKKADEGAQEQIYHFYMAQKKYINNWNLVDGSAPYVVGMYLLHKDKEILLQLAQSSNLWERRISIVATAAFIRHSSFETTLKIAEILLNDTHDLIHKAVGWMLREVGKKDVNVLKSFLDQHGHRMPRTMLRYAIERLNTEQRKFYLQKRG